MLGNERFLLLRNNYLQESRLWSTRLSTLRMDIVFERFRIHFFLLLLFFCVAFLLPKLLASSWLKFLKKAEMKFCFSKILDS